MTIGSNTLTCRTRKEKVSAESLGNAFRRGGNFTPGRGVPRQIDDGNCRLRPRLGAPSDSSGDSGLQPWNGLLPPIEPILKIL